MVYTHARSLLKNLVAQGKPSAAASRKRISDPWAEEEQEHADGEALAASGDAEAGAGGAKPTLSLEGGAGAAAGAEDSAAPSSGAMSVTVGAGGAEKGDGFVVAPRVPGKNVKRPVRPWGGGQRVLRGWGRRGGGVLGGLGRGAHTVHHASRMPRDKPRCACL